jgi:uncharacterized protein (TIGR03067 family)
MRACIGVVLVTAFAALSAGAPLPKSPPPKSPDIAGRWVLVSAGRGGDAIPLRVMELDYEFTSDGREIVRSRVGTVSFEYVYAIDRDMSPPTLDVRDKVGGPVIRRGIYAVEGDTLTICITTGPDALRPTKLETPAGSKVELRVYTRAKKD